MEIGIVQNNPRFGEKSANIRALLDGMAEKKADLYVLPELCATGYNFSAQSQADGMAEPFSPEGETFNAFAEFAHRRNCRIVYGFIEKSDQGIFNSAGMVGPDGACGLYRKIHLFDREKLFFKPGDLGFQVFPTPWGTVGIMICFDWYFPESARTLCLKGAELIAHPSNLVLPHCPDSMPVRCRENRIFVATANRVGTEDRGGVALTFIGQSQMTSPLGEILFRASKEHAQVLTCDVDLAQAERKNLNQYNHLINDRRPEFYMP
jgi:5-aminopentanamidase